MAFGKKYEIKLVNRGRVKRIHDIVIKHLPKSKIDLLSRFKFFKWISKNEQSIEVIFKIEDNSRRTKRSSRLIWNPFQNKCTTEKELIRDEDFLEWKCAICSVDIICDIKDTGIENFVCDKCGTVHNKTNKIIDVRVVESSQEFLSFCQRLYKDEQNEFIKFSRDRAKRLSNT